MLYKPWLGFGGAKNGMSYKEPSVSKQWSRLPQLVWLFFVGQNIRRYCTTGVAASILGILRASSVY